MALGRPRSRVGCGLVVPPNTSSTLTRLSRHSSLPPYVHAIHTSYPHCQLNTNLFVFPYHHAVYRNYFLAHPTQKAWTQCISTKLDGTSRRSGISSNEGSYGGDFVNAPEELAPFI